MTRISDLSQDLIEEILSRVSITSLRAVRSTCKQWNGLNKDESFTKKHLAKAAKDTMVIMVCDSKACLVSVDLEGAHNRKGGLVELSTKLLGKLNRFKVQEEVYHCDGLLLCFRKNSMPVVWNPYLGQVRWIEPRKKELGIIERYYMGYDNKNNHKVLRLVNNGSFVQYEMYDFKSDSWRDLDVTCEWNIDHYRECSCLKGNTYFVAQGAKDSLICFDFTSERFRHCLDLDSNSRNGDSVILSTVREEQLAVLSCSVGTCEMEIRITTKIEANKVTWRSFLKIDVKKPFTRMFWKFLWFCNGGGFFVDEKKKVALIWDKYRHKAYLVGEDNYFEVVAQGKSTYWPVVCFYVPSSVQIQKGPLLRKVHNC